MKTKINDLSNESKVANFLLDYLNNAEGNIQAFNLNCQYCPLREECRKSGDDTTCAEFLTQKLQGA